MPQSLPQNMMQLFGFDMGQGQNDQGGGQDVYQKGRDALYGGSQMGMGSMQDMMSSMAGGYASGGSVEDHALNIVREHLRRGGRPFGHKGFVPQFENDTDAMARGMIAEAGGHGDQAMLNVGFNLRNRADANYRGYGSGIQNQLMAQTPNGGSGQYSSFLRNNPSSNIAGINAMKVPTDSEQYKHALELAGQVQGRIAPDTTQGASHYFNPAGMPHHKAPPWVHDPGMEFIFKDPSGHQFYRSAGFNPQQPNDQPKIGDQQMLASQQAAHNAGIADNVLDQQATPSMATYKPLDPIQQPPMQPAPIPNVPAAAPLPIQPISAPPAPPQSMIDNAVFQPQQPPLAAPQHIAGQGPMNTPLPPMRSDNFHSQANVPQPPMRPEHFRPQVDAPTPPGRPFSAPRAPEEPAGPRMDEMGWKAPEEIRGKVDFMKPFDGPSAPNATPEPSTALPDAPSMPEASSIPSPADGSFTEAFNFPDIGGGLDDIFGFLQRGGRVGFANGGEAEGSVSYAPEGHEQLPPIDVGRPHEDRPEHRVALPDISVGQARPDWGSAHDVVRHRLDSGEAQLPQMDREAVKNWQEGAKEAAHIAAYGIPYVGQALMGYDLANAGRTVLSPEFREKIKGGDYLGAGIDVADVPLAMFGAGGGKAKMAAAGLGAVASAMAPEDAQAFPFRRFGNEAAQIAARLAREAGYGVDPRDQIGVFHSVDASRIPEMVRRFDASIPAPSMAIAKPGAVPALFGDTTLVGGAHLAVPTEENRIFGADAFTPRVPEIVKGTKTDPRVATYANKYLEKHGGNRDAAISEINSLYGYDKKGTELVSYLSDPNSLGLSEYFKGENNERIAPTAENAVALMRAQGLIGSEKDVDPGIGLLKAAATPEFKTIGEIQKSRPNLMREFDPNDPEWRDAEAEAAVYGAGFRHHAAPEHAMMAQYYPDRLFIKAATDKAMRGWDAVKETYPTVPDAKQYDMDRYIKMILGLNPSYYEAKPMRPVGIDEFSGAVVPKNMRGDRAATSLVEAGVPSHGIRFYTPENEVERYKALRELQGGFFSAGGEVEEERAEKGGGGRLETALELARKLGRLMPEGSGYTPPAGKPGIVTLPGIGRVEARPIEDIEASKSALMRAQGRTIEQPEFKPVNPAFSAKIADAFERMKHDPADPLVKRSYEALIEDTMAQYRAAKDAGYDFHMLKDGEADPYHLSPALGYADLVNNRRLAVFPTDQGFGTMTQSAADNPLLTRVGRVGDKDDAVANDAFRIVHDVYGHHGPGNPFFRAAGEERAYQAHAPMFSEQALPALTAETRGQNSWVNFGPHGAANQSADGALTVYADQKVGRLPEWTMAPPPAEDVDVDDYVRHLIRRAAGGRTNAAEDTSAHDFVTEQLNSGEPQLPQQDRRFERGMSEMFGMPEAEAGEASAAAKAFRAAMRLGKQTVDNPQRNLFPGIYGNPREIAEEAESRVAPESLALKQLFGVTRQDLYDMGAARAGNAEPELAFSAKPRGSEATENVMTRRNAKRLQNVLYEAGEQPGLRTGMDAWYVMDPLYQRMEQLLGKDEAIRRFDMLNHSLGTMSPGSPVTTEVNRGLAAYHLDTMGRYNDFVKYGGNPAAATSIPRDRNRSFAEEFPDLLGHPYHSTSQAPILQKYLETGDHGMQSPKVPLYIQSSGVPETGFQTKLPVPDAHFTRAVGLSDTRKAHKGAGDSMKMAEFQQLGPWFSSKVANKVGLEAVPAQARLWGAMSGQTGVDTAIGSPKIEMIANEIMRIAHKYGISPERARDMVLQGEIFNRGGAVNDNGTDPLARAKSLASAT